MSAKRGGIEVSGLDGRLARGSQAYHDLLTLRSILPPAHHAVPLPGLPPRGPGPPGGRRHQVAPEFSATLPRTFLARAEPGGPERVGREEERRND